MLVTLLRNIVGWGCLYNYLIQEFSFVPHSDILIRPRYAPGFPSFPVLATRFREKSAINSLFSTCFPSEKNRQVWASYSDGSHGGSGYESKRMWGNPISTGHVYNGDVCLSDGTARIITPSRFVSRAHVQKKIRSSIQKAPIELFFKAISGSD